MPLRSLTLLPLVALIAAPLTATAEASSLGRYGSEKASFEVVELADGLDHPWGMDFLPDGDIVITERNGGIQRWDRDTGALTEIAGAPRSHQSGQGGLLDIALDPNFAETPWVYISHAGAGNEIGGTVVTRAKLVGDRLVDHEVIFEAQPKTRGRSHYGSRFAFMDDGTLLVTLGDRYSHLDEAQNLDNHIGTTVRINPDGSVPADNPFVGHSDARPEVFSYGHRNQQGLAIAPDGTIWQHEHGPRGGDEVNVLEPGKNYGWPAITYGINYSGSIISEETHAPGMEQPVIYWDPSIAPSGLAYYDGDAFPGWKGSLFVGALKFLHLRRLTLDGREVVAQEELLKPLSERIRDVAVGPDGLIYVLTDSSDGLLLQLRP